MDKRYTKFLLEDSEVPELPETTGEGLHRIHYDISEIEQCENRNQAKILESLFYTVCEVFEIKDIEMQTTGHANSFFLITKHETDFNVQEGILSPELSRNKLKDATAMELSGVVIDLLLDRKIWDKEMSYKTLNI